jgi:DNA recombination protein RmuC
MFTDLTNNDPRLITAIISAAAALISGLSVFVWQRGQSRLIEQALQESRLKAEQLQEQQIYWQQQATNAQASLERAESESRSAQLDSARFQERLTRTLEQLSKVEQQARVFEKDARESMDRLQSQMSQTRAELAREREARVLQQQHAEEKLTLLEQNKVQLLKDFELLSQKIYEQKQREFSEQSKQGLDTLLTPFRQQLDGLRKKVEDVHLSDAKDRASLKSQMVELHKLNQQMSQEAHALTTALRGEKKTQGNWGEMVLETVLERSGLRKGEEYERESSQQSADGQRYRPDVIIKLPEGKHIIVDSKVSLNAYTDYVNAESELEQASALKRHVESVRNHVRSLSDKAYQQLDGLNSPDFVFLFMPIEPAFMLAFQTDESLFNQAFEKKIVVVTPTTLLATLRTVASIWAIERRNQSTEKLADQAGKLYDKLVVVVDRFEKVGTQLGTLSKSYDEAWNSLKSGRGNLVSQADGFRKLGVRVKKDLSKQLVEEAKAEDELYEAISTRQDGEPNVADAASSTSSNV